MEEEKIKSPWPGPAGLIPVTSGKAEDANVINRRYLDSLMVEMRVIDAVEPSLETVVLGQRLTSPIMMPAFSHLNKVGKDGRQPMQEYAAAAKQMGLLNWVGMEPDDDFAAIAAVGAPTYILPRISEALRGSGVSVFCDCGIATGYDAYKALALGADAVAVGRGILAPLLQKGTEGVVEKVKQMNSQLRELMIYTSVADTSSFDPTVIHRG